jgi:hypothetical protein
MFLLYFTLPGLLLDVTSNIQDVHFWVWDRERALINMVMNFLAP